ncbi:MAG: beta-aspartyl-peptidase (threonine type) [Kiritimatiellia bacterium]|jgi:beta-aspartyl-peptidase (threonine type)
MLPTLAIHGGAGLIRRASLSAERERQCRRALDDALDAGCAVLDADGSAMEAVIAAVVSMEDDPVFNAGHGAVIAADGSFELDAAVMCGKSRQAGAVTGVRTTRSPVSLARAVLDHTAHVFFAGPGADHLAQELQLEQVDPSFFSTQSRRDQFERLRGTRIFDLDHGGASKDVYGTVGAVACDQQGHLAAATSTGGMVNKRPGRVGDTPVIGAGTFAWDQTAAVSMTGHGEPCLLLGAAGRVSALMELLGLDLEAACDRVIHQDLPSVQGLGGLIAVDALGNVCMPFNTGGMFRAARCSDGVRTIEIW